MPKANDKTAASKRVTPTRPQQQVRQSISFLKTEVSDIKATYKQQITLLQQKIQSLQLQNQTLKHSIQTLKNDLKKDINKERSNRQKQIELLASTKREKSPLITQIMPAKKSLCLKCYQQQISNKGKSKVHMGSPNPKSSSPAKQNTSSHQNDSIVEYIKQSMLKQMTKSKQLPQLIKEWSETIINMVQDLQSKLKIAVTEIKLLSKTNKQQLLNSFIEQSQKKIAVLSEQSNKIQSHHQSLASEIPVLLTQLRQVWGTKEQNYKKQIEILKKQIVQEKQKEASLVLVQQAQIVDLRNRLIHLAGTYHEHIQIPINAIRQKIEAEISQTKADFFKLRTNRTTNQIINSLISSVKNYLNYKDKDKNGKMHEQIKNTSVKLTEMKDRGMQTLQKIGAVIKTKDFQPEITLKELDDKLKIKEMQINRKKKQYSHQELEERYSKQTQYLVALEKYKNKLEDSVRRNTQQKELFDSWNRYYEQCRERDKEFNSKSDKVAADFRQVQAELIEIKKNILANMQSNRDVITMFHQFQSQVSAIQSYKDELFNYLQNEIKLSKAIESQVQIFNNIFVTQFNQLSKLKTKVPEIQSIELADYSAKDIENAQLLNRDAQKYLNFKNQYSELFKQKRMIETKITKSLVSLSKIHDIYTNQTKDKHNLSISFDKQILKKQQENTNKIIENISVGVKKIREYVITKYHALKRQCEASNQHLIKLTKSIPKHKSPFTNKTPLSSKNKNRTEEHFPNTSLISFENIEKDEINNY